MSLISITDILALARPYDCTEVEVVCGDTLGKLFSSLSLGALTLVFAVVVEILTPVAQVFTFVYSNRFRLSFWMQDFIGSATGASAASAPATTGLATGGTTQGEAASE